MKKLALFFLLFGASFALGSDGCSSQAPPEVSVDLRNPVYKNGVLFTNQGGVISAEDLRIQARSIQYIRQTEGVEPAHRIEAEGDLMLLYKGRIYVGTGMEYDFLTGTGVVYQGKTFSSLWYVGGEQICLYPDGSYKVVDATATACEKKESTWDLHAEEIGVIKDELLEAQRVRFRLFQVPVFWLPSFKMSLQKFKDPVFRYYVDWDKGQGPRAGFRYQLYSWEEFAFYGRLEYRWRTGWGGAFETEYYPENRRTTFVTRSYLGTDRLETAPDKMRRYRLVGALSSVSESGKTRTELSWDKYSDVRMPADFQEEDFEVNPAKRTLFSVFHKEDFLLSYFKVRPRANPFESIKQDLPTLYAAPHPQALGSSGLLSANYLKASYMDFAYSSQLAQSLPGFQTVRIEAAEELYRPFRLGAMTLTPHIGGIALFYGTSPSHEPKTLGVLTYGAKANLQAKRTFAAYKHILEPYLEYKALSRPTVSPDSHYIFTIQDGYQKIQQIEIGVRNLLFANDRPKKEAHFTGDLYAIAFFSDTTIPQMIPRGYLRLGWNLPSLFCSLHSCWNFRHHQPDFINARCKWTVNEDIALSLEARYRSEYDWRKADHESFILDVTRPESSLLLSPLSDRRITFLAHLFIRLTPFWECHIQSHHGFLRFTEDPYNEVRVDFFTWLNSALKLRLSYSHLDLDDRVTAGISLIKK